MIRLPHVLGAMGLILAAGLGTAAWVQARTGGATVPGLIVIDVPHLPPGSLSRWAVPDGTVVTLPSPPGPLGPFTPERVARLRARGHRTSLYTLAPDLDRAALRESGAWASLFDRFGATAGATRSDALVAAAAVEIRARAGSRSFVLGLLPAPSDAIDPDRLLAPLAAAAAGLPWFRRCSIVVLGAWVDEGSREVLRLDIGRGAGKASADLDDLLEPSW